MSVCKHKNSTYLLLIFCDIIKLFYKCTGVTVLKVICIVLNKAAL